MSLLTPHLLLRSESGPSLVATVLRSAGYVVSKVTDDLTAESIAGASHVDGVVIELPTLAGINLARRLQASYGAGVLMIVVTDAPETVRRSVPQLPAIATSDVETDLVSTVDLALATHLMSGALKAVAS